MASARVERILSLLKGHRICGSGWTALCPAHDDSHNSLSMGIGRNGEILLCCHAGCKTEDVVSAMGLTMSDLFSEKVRRKGRVHQEQAHLTLEDLARAKKLPVEFLQKLGWRDSGQGVVIPYCMPNGDVAREKLRRSLLHDGIGDLPWTQWLGVGPVVPLGLQWLHEAKLAGDVVIVEGETDFATLHLHGFPSLALPGADMASKIHAIHLAEIRRVYVTREPGKGGDTLTADMALRLREIGYVGQAFQIRMPDGIKDPNDLHKRDPEAFKAAFQQALDAAEPLEIHKDDGSPEPARAGSVVDLLVSTALGSLQADSTPAEIERALRELAVQLTEADPLRKAVAREAAINSLKAIGVRAPAAMVDAALTIEVTQNGEDLQGGAVTFSEPELWESPVDGADLLDELASAFARFVVLPDHAAEGLALWVLHAWALLAVFTTPILAITSPTKRCGKSTLIDLLLVLVPRPLFAANITAPALFRSIEKYRPTLLIDEADTFLPDNEELRGVLNSGHTRTTAKVIRTVGDQHEVRTFSTFCPKAIARIGKLADTLDDRSILVPMRRKTRGERRERLRRDRINAEMEPLRRQAARWVADHIEEIRAADPTLPEELHDRAQDNWRSLIAIADLAAGTWVDRARRAAVALTGATNEADNTPSVQLLGDIRDLFRLRTVDRLPSREIVAHLVQMEDRPWPEWYKGKPMSETQLAKLLRPFGVRSKTIRIGSTTPRGYELSWFQDTFSRYLTPSEPQQPQQACVANDLEQDLSRNTNRSVAGVGTSVSAHEQSDVAAVADQNPGDTEESLPVEPAEGWEDIEV